MPIVVDLIPPSLRTNVAAFLKGRSESIGVTILGLLDADHHGVRPRQGFDVASGESDLGHPTPAVCASEVEPKSLDEHVETHQQTECVLTPVIVDDRFMNDKRPTCGQGVERLLEQLTLLIEIPVVQDVAHDEHVGMRQRVGEEIPAVKVRRSERPHFAT